MVNDTISDMLTRLRNANLAKHQIVEVPSTKMTRNIASILLEEGFIQSFEEIGENFNAQLLLSLKYKNSNRSILYLYIRLQEELLVQPLRHLQEQPLAVQLLLP